MSTIDAIKSDLDDIDILLNLPAVLPIITLEYPKVFYPFAAERFLCFVEEQSQLSLLMEDIRACGNLAVFVPTKPGTKFPYESSDLNSVGVVAQIFDMETTSDGKFRCLARGLDRVTIGKIEQEKPYFKAQMSLDTPLMDFYEDEAKDLHRDVLTLMKRLYAIIEHTSEEEARKNLLPYTESPMHKASFLFACLLQTTAFADWSGWIGKHILSLDGAFALELLTCNSDKERLTLLKHFLDREVPLFEAQQPQQTTLMQNGKRTTRITKPLTPEHSPSPESHNTESPRHHDFDTSLGKDIKTGGDIWISQSARRSGMLILGSTGYGKSGLINHMVSSDMRAVIQRKGGRKEKIGICVIAPDGDLIDSIISRVPKEREEDVILIDPIALARRDAYPGMNLFFCPDPLDPALSELTVEQVLSMFRKLLGLTLETTPRLADFVQQLTRSLIGTQYTLVDVPDILLNEHVRARAIPHPNTFWKTYNLLKVADQFERAESTLTRVSQFSENQILKYIIGQADMFDFAKAIDSGKIILINIPGEYEHLGKLLGGVVIGQILLAMLGRKDTPRSERGFFNLYIDEFQNYVSPTINKMATECRKYGLGLTVAHQSTEQEGITDEIKATTRQVGSKIFFRLSNIDAPEVADVFDTTPPPGDLIERPVRVPAQYVTKHLLEKGHENPEIIKLVNDYIRPIYEHPANKYTDGSYTFVRAALYEKWKNQEVKYCTFSGVWESVEKPLNRFLVQLMEGSIALGSVAYERALYPVVLTLSGYLHFDLYYMTEGGYNTAGGFSPAQISSVSVSSANIPQMEEMKKDIFWLIVQAHHRPDPDTLLQEPIAKRTAVWEQIVNDPQKAKENAERECRKIFYFCSALGLLGIRLHQSPIMIDSGKYEKVEGPRMTPREVTDRIANTLTHLPPRQAMMSLPSGEYTMKTHDIPGVPDITKKKERILENTIRQFCKSRSQVEEEIAARTKQGSQPQTTRKYTLVGKPQEPGKNGLDS